MRGVMNIEKQGGQTPEEQINLLENTEKPHWEDLAANAEAQGEKRRAQMFKLAAETAQLKADYIRLRENQQPESEEVLSMLDEEIANNYLTRFERFKQWAKENLGAISVAAISVAGIITTIAVSFRRALKKGAKATGRFAKGLANVGKKVAPILSSLLGILSSILSMGAKGLSFLSKNLWILAVVLTYYLYREMRKKYKKQ